MKLSQPASMTGAKALLTTALLLTLGSAWAAAAGSYAADRAACLSGAGGQETTACLREAGAARAEQQRGRLGAAPSAEALMHNALLRCVEMAPERRQICERMVRGEGQVSGSVAGGGQVRELITVVPASAPGQ